MAPSSSEEDDDSSRHSDEEEENHSENEQEEIEDNNNNDEDEEDDDDDDDSDGNDDDIVAVVAKKPKKIHRLSLTETENFNEKLKKRGVMYIARIPPKMTPTKIKSLLSEFCEVTRVYLVPEDASKRKRRKKEHGRSGGKRYTEGWVEMESKKKAKRIAMSLNNTPISNHKRNPHYGDLWNLKYLPKFKWSHLTEKVAYERRVREQKLRVEMMHARRENAAYVQMVETGKKLDKIEARKRKRGEGGEAVIYDDAGDKKKNRRHKHRQTRPMNSGSDKSAKKALLSGLV